MEFPALVPGPYTLYVDPQEGRSGTLRVRLWKSLAGTLVLGDAPLSASLIEGQTARFAFTLGAAQFVGVGVWNLASGPSGSNVTFDVLRPDDTSPNLNQWSRGCNTGSVGSGCDLPESPNVLSAGSYVLRVTPAIDRTSANATVIVSSDATGSLMPAGTPVPVTVARRGQKARLSFTASAGQTRQVDVSGWQTQPATGNGTRVFVRKPSGTVQEISSYWGPTFTIPLSSSTLNETGTYELIMDQFDGLTFSFSATLAP